ncbi:MAG: hypothetical protein SF029_02145 [bacterium]|nr:hypothetical protein [bacterium]
MAKIFVIFAPLWFVMIFFVYREIGCVCPALRAKRTELPRKILIVSLCQMFYHDSIEAGTEAER